MTAEQQIDQALAYFTDQEHACSYELLEGEGNTLISAPHAMLQTRNGAVKCAERFTGMLCRMLHERINCPVIYKTRHLRDDANFDPVSDYRDAICRYAGKHPLSLVIDLHQMKPERATDICIGTGKGNNLLGGRHIVAEVADAFRAIGLNDIAIDHPFDACGPNTVCSTVVKRCHIPSLQLELNTRLLMTGYDEYCFMRVLDTLCDLVVRLNRNQAEIIAL